MKVFLSLLCFSLFVLQPIASIAADAGTGGGSFDAGGIRMQFEAMTGSLDSFDSTDRLATPSEGWSGGVYHIKYQDGWLGDTGFYSTDYRSPLMPGESKAWTFYVWALPGTPVSNGGLGGGLWSSDASNLNVVLECIQKPVGITGGPTVGTVWTPQTPVNVLLPFYNTSDGRTGYGFRLTLTAVPEPSSLAALAFGILPIGAAAIRRRRR